MLFHLIVYHVPNEGENIVKIIGFVAALAVLATPALAADKAPPVDRAAALARAPQFHDPIEAALTQKPNTLYLAALAGKATDQWAWGLALVATRFDTDSVPPAQLALYKAYDEKVGVAEAAYQKQHPKEDISDKDMAFFVKPTDEEAQAVTIVEAINSPNLWLGKAHEGGIEAAVINQSVRCLAVVKEHLDAESLMSQILGGMGSPAAGKKDQASSKGNVVSLADILNGPKDEASKTEEDRDEDALCGGSDALQHVKSLMRAVYTPPFRVTVSTNKKK